MQRAPYHSIIWLVTQHPQPQLVAQHKNAFPLLLQSTLGSTQTCGNPNLRETEKEEEGEQERKERGRERVGQHPSFLSCLSVVHLSSSFTWGSVHLPGGLTLNSCTFLGGDSILHPQQRFGLKAKNKHIRIHPTKHTYILIARRATSCKTMTSVLHSSHTCFEDQIKESNLERDTHASVTILYCQQSDCSWQNAICVTHTTVLKTDVHDSWLSSPSQMTSVTCMTHSTPCLTVP